MSIKKTNKLYVVPTPLGNLEDITLRALRILKECELILAEDTRTSSVLLNHYQIKTKLIAHHKYNEHKTLTKLIEELLSGKQIALISDAGTPGISDPGFLLIRACIEHAIEIEVLPGATAFVPALLQSGFALDEFVFVGFLPVKKGRETKFKQLAEEKRTIVFYESPYRILKTLEQCKVFFGDERKLSVSRELTKKFEETVRGSASELLAHFRLKEPKGEFVIVINAIK